MSIFGSIMSAIFKSGSHAAGAPHSAPPLAPAAPPVDAGTMPAPPSSSSTATATLDRPDAGTTEVKTAESQAGASAAAQSSAAATAPGSVDVAAILTKLASQNEERLDWRRSIVDLMKLLHLDSSLAARKELARELHYTGNMNDSAAMNVWLHRQVMLKLAENGGKVPAELMAR